MKGQPNVQLVQQAYQSVKNGDTQTLLNMLAQDVLWELPEMPNVPFSGTWKGRQQVGEFFRKMNEVQDVIEFKPEQFVGKRPVWTALMVPADCGHISEEVRRPADPVTGACLYFGWLHKSQ